MVKTKQQQIKRLQTMIQMMRDDEEMFGLTGEDTAKISRWKGEISVLQQQLKKEDTH